MGIDGGRGHVKHNFATERRSRDAGSEINFAMIALLSALCVSCQHFALGLPMLRATLGTPIQCVMKCETLFDTVFASVCFGEK